MNHVERFRAVMAFQAVERVADLSDVGIVRAARVEVIPAAWGQRDLGKTIGTNRSVRRGAYNLRTEEPVRMKRHLPRHARCEEMVTPVFPANGGTAPDPVIRQFEASARDCGLEAGTETWADQARSHQRRGAGNPERRTSPRWPRWLSQGIGVGSSQMRLGHTTQITVQRRRPAPVHQNVPSSLTRTERAARWVSRAKHGTEATERQVTGGEIHGGNPNWSKCGVRANGAPRMRPRREFVLQIGREVVDCFPEPWVPAVKCTALEPPQKVTGARLPTGPARPPP